MSQPNKLEAAVRFYEMSPAKLRDFMMRDYVKSEYGTDDDSVVAQCLREIHGYIAERDEYLGANGNGHSTPEELRRAEQQPEEQITPNARTESRGSEAQDYSMADVFAELEAEEQAAAAVEPDALSTSPSGVMDESQAHTFFDSIATPLIERGWRVAPCYPHNFVDASGKTMGKTVHGELVPRPLEMISDDPAVIYAWGLREPNANVCVYAQQVEGGLLFVDKDGATSLVEKYERETGKKFPQTLLVCSSIAEDAQGTYSKGHWYFHQTPRTMALEKNIREIDTDGLFSLRLHNQYVASIGSIHPTTKRPYTIAWDNPVLPMPDDFLDWLLAQVVRDKPVTEKKSGERRLVPHGQIHGAYVAEAGRLLNAGYELEDVVEMTIKWTLSNCEPPIDIEKVRKEATDVCNRYERGEYQGLDFNQKPAAAAPAGMLECEGERLSHEEEAVEIPPFDRSIMKGIYKEIVDELTRGTTLEPQFIYAISKVVVGAKMAGKVRFADLSVEPLTYLALCGSSGSGKGEAWRRFLCVLNAKDSSSMTLNNPLSCGARIKIINSADSGAGLKDAFFESPADQPILCFIDEVASLGHKAGEKKNPEIIDVMGELANSTSVSRVKAKKSGKQPSVKNKDNAYLAVVLCGQNSEVFTSAFTGRTKVGWWDRLVPEYGTPQEVGDLPPIDNAAAVRLLRKINDLNYSGTMQIDVAAKARLEEFWKSQPTEIRTVARLKQQLKLDTYLEAFGRGVMTVELPDVEDSIKSFARQMVIRKMMFRGEVPDRVGFYLGGIKELTDWMRQRLAEGMPAAQVARSWRDYEKKTNARRNNEEHIFVRAMETHAKHHLYKVPVKSKNGSTYERYLPLLEDE